MPAYCNYTKITDILKGCCEESIQTLFYFNNATKNVMEMQTVKTLIRLLLREQSDLGLHCFPPGATKLGEIYGKFTLLLLNDQMSGIESDR